MVRQAAGEVNELEGEGNPNLLVSENHRLKGLTSSGFVVGLALGLEVGNIPKATSNCSLLETGYWGISTPGRTFPVLNSMELTTNFQAAHTKVDCTLYQPVFNLFTDCTKFLKNGLKDYKQLQWQK